ncbi:acyl-CoA thioesterase/bile acid-CoA:amino acid N-acyltransferase family protein [Saccharothrix obliqua]|uniref:acyl-CoA thioesterase/bile acid-CoA:amino acid N-acyltransferase family protein n=1 Tax=Saccharothrix obliqua TaxID=2861747 RepID=UPI003556356C
MFRADERGVVDLARHAPISGDYSGVDPMGLFWSMRPGEATPHHITIEVTTSTTHLRTEVERLHIPDGITRTEIPALSATKFTRSGANAPGVIVLGNRDRPELDAALLAGHGFTTLALTYYGDENTPEDLVDVPLEHVAAAIDHLTPETTSIGVLGSSRGGELALLAAATFPALKAAVSVAGSGVVTQCIGPGKRLLQKLDHEAAAWTYRGDPLPYLPYTIQGNLRHRVVNGEPIPLRLAYDLSDGIPEAAEIPVERIAGGVLLLSPGADETAPSAALSEVAERRLTAHAHPFRHEHVVYPEAGHLIAGPPHRPTTATTVPGPGVRLLTGGTPAATAAARVDAWRRTIEFLSDQLGT